jgi:hypothetical protein
MRNCLPLLALIAFTFPAIAEKPATQDSATQAPAASPDLKPIFNGKTSLDGTVMNDFGPFVTASSMVRQHLRSLPKETLF